MEPAETKPVILITGWSLVLGAILLNVIAIGTPYWIYFSSIDGVIYAGLWTACIKTLLSTVAICSELGNL